MKWLEKKTDKGVLKYRMPDISEGYEFLACCDDMKTGTDILRIKARFIKMMSPMLDYSALGYAAYEDLLNDKENMAIPIKEVVQEIFDDVTGMFRKKPSSSMPSTSSAPE